MPKISRHRTTIARHEPTGLYERITISDPHKFKDVGKHHVPYKPFHKPLVHHPADPEIMRQGDEDIKRLALLASLLKQLRDLEHAPTPAPSVPLIDRIEPRPVTYDLPKAIPKTLRFRKKQNINRVKDYNILFGATVDRLDTFVGMVETDTRLTAETRDGTLKWVTDLDNLYHELEARERKLTNKQWRLIKRDLKRIGRVSFVNLRNRLPEICEELLKLELNFSYGV